MTKRLILNPSNIHYYHANFSECLRKVQMSKARFAAGHKSFFEFPSAYHYFAVTETQLDKSLEIIKVF